MVRARALPFRFGLDARRNGEGQNLDDLDEPDILKKTTMLVSLAGTNARRTPCRARRNAVWTLD